MRLASEAMGVPNPPILTRHEQGGVIYGEFGKQHRRRHVGNDLTAERAEKQRVARHQHTERFLYGGYPRHVAREHEKRAEREEQAVVHLHKGFAVEKDQRERNRGQPPVIGKHAENDQHRQREEREINGRPPAARFCVRLREHHGGLLFSRRGRR